MQPVHLRLFADIAEAGSISAVAQARGQAQSHLSRQLTQLERDCGGVLFYRNGRGVTLSELGQQTLPKVLAWLNSTDALMADIRHSGNTVSGRVKIGIMPSAAHPLTTELFRRARHQYPNIHLQISEAGALLEEWVETGKLDLALLFRYGKRLKPGEQALATSDICLVGPPGDLITREPQVEFARVAGLPLALPALRSDLRKEVEEIARQKRMHLNVVVDANSINFQNAVVAAGLCYSLMGGTTTARDVASGRLQAARIIKPGIKRTMVLAVSQQGQLSTACKIIIKLIEQIAADNHNLWPAPID